MLTYIKVIKDEKRVDERFQFYDVLAIKISQLTLYVTILTTQKEKKNITKQIAMERRPNGVEPKVNKLTGINI